MVAHDQIKFAVSFSVGCRALHSHHLSRPNLNSAAWASHGSRVGPALPRCNVKNQLPKTDPKLL